MACLVFKQLDGSERRVPPSPDGQFRRAAIPGEVYIGVDPDCGGEIVLESVTDQAARLLTELDAKLGKHGGDWIKAFASPVARVIGKQNCMSCEVRRVVVNAYANLKARYGMLVALFLMGKLWYTSVKSPEKAVVRLKEYLKLNA